MQKLKLEYIYNDTVARIILDDGKGNVLDSNMMGELNEVLESFKSNKDLKLITFEGAGKHFSFGASVEEHTKEKAPAMLKSFHQIFYTITDLSIPTLAKLSGQCLGGGLELALVCNFLFADQTAKLGQPEIVLGVFAPPASVILPLKIGNVKAEELLLTGKSISAEEGKQVELINNVFENRQVMETEIDKWITENILPKSASSLRYAVKASRVKFNHILRKMLPEVEEMYLKGLIETNDANEGINSFLEKRKPDWKNC
ncbi:MAG: enoyl-CoA hydratase-related protein [Ignavibacteria bacterium]|jgi:cyclohexa-1,5-dienecarbonyl-CoA hydratase